MLSFLNFLASGVRGCQTSTLPGSASNVMSLIRKLAYSIGGFLLVLVAVGALLPATAHVERNIHIDAPQASVFALVNDFRQINKWSPWVDTDPNALYTISGPPRGVGATMTWDGQIVGPNAGVING